jgi:hypothetical protein
MGYVAFSFAVCAAILGRCGFVARDPDTLIGVQF